MSKYGELSCRVLATIGCSNSPPAVGVKPWFFFFEADQALLRPAAWARVAPALAAAAGLAGAVGVGDCRLTLRCSVPVRPSA